MAASSAGVYCTKQIELFPSLLLYIVSAVYKKGPSHAASYSGVTTVTYMFSVIFLVETLR